MIELSFYINYPFSLMYFYHPLALIPMLRPGAFACVLLLSLLQASSALQLVRTGVARVSLAWPTTTAALRMQVEVRATPIF